MVICITNRALCRRDFLDQFARIAAARPETILLRERDLDDAAYEALARRCMAVLAPFSVPLTVHARPHIARRIGAKRVHLPLALLASQPGLLVSCPVHSVEDVLLAQARGADRLIAGHVFQTDCKQGVPPRGLPFLRAVCAAAERPVFAIGGITPERAAQVRACGAAGGCMMSALMRADDPAALIQTYRAAWACRT